MPWPLVYIVLVCCYALLVHQYRLAARNGGSSLVQLLSGKRDLNLFNHRHFAGLLIMLFGVICFFSWPGAKVAWLQPQVDEDRLWLLVVMTVGATAFSCYAGFTASRFNTIKSGYRQVELYLLLRLLYLVVYEVFFRLALLQAALAFAPVAVAVGINVFLYAVAHRYSPRREMWASVPLGSLLCYLTLQQGSVWPAAVVHGLLSLPYEAILLTRKQVQQTYVS